MELVFEDVRLKTRFVIARTLRIIVGSQEDHDSLKPKSPYVPRKQTVRQPETSIIEGVAPPALKAIPYVDQLPIAEIPKPLAVTLSTGKVSEIIGRIRQTYLPSNFASSTYARHFKYLLWIEEHRME